MKILVTGACGQIGSELVPVLRSRYGRYNVVASDIDTSRLMSIFDEPSTRLDVVSRQELEKTIEAYDIDVVVHLAAILSARGEENPQLAWRVNIEGLYNVLEVAREYGLKMVFIPSSIAVYGPETPDNPGDITIMRPKTIYGISKLLAELLGEYYYTRYGLDVRGLRLPGVISWRSRPGGGTTDYAVEAFYSAVMKREYVFWVRPDTTLPMIYMPDVVRAFIEFMETDNKRLTLRFYNIQGMSFSAQELADVIKKYIPEFRAYFRPDPVRQRIADSWPKRIDDSMARRDWGWRPEWDLEKMAADMIYNLEKTLLGGGSLERRSFTP